MSFTIRSNKQAEAVAEAPYIKPVKRVTSAIHCEKGKSYCGYLARHHKGIFDNNHCIKYNTYLNTTTTSAAIVKAVRCGECVRDCPKGVEV